MDITFEAAQQPQRRLVACREIELRRSASRECLVEPQPPFDDLVAPMIGKFVEAREFESEEMLDDVLDRVARSWRSQYSSTELVGEPVDPHSERKRNSTPRTVI